MSTDQLSPVANRVPLEVIVGSQYIKKIHINPDRSWIENAMKWNYFAWCSWETGEECVCISILCNELLCSDQLLTVACKTTYCYKFCILKTKQTIA